MICCKAFGSPPSPNFRSLSHTECIIRIHLKQKNIFCTIGICLKHHKNTFEQTNIFCTKGIFLKHHKMTFHAQEYFLHCKNVSEQPEVANPAAETPSSVHFSLEISFTILPCSTCFKGAAVKCVFWNCLDVPWSVCALQLVWYTQTRSLSYSPIQ